MKQQILFIIIAALVGCAYTESYTLDPNPSVYSKRIVIIDSRPDADKHHKPCAFNCPPIYKHRDDGFRPKIAEYLSFKLPKDFPPILGKEVQLLRFEVVDYFPNRAKRYAGTALAGISYSLAILANPTYKSEIDLSEDLVVTGIKIKFNERVYETAFAQPMKSSQTSSSKINGKTLTQLSVEGAIKQLIAMIRET